MRRLALLTAVAIVCVIAVRPKAVTDGRLDGNAHPAVVLLLMEVENEPAFRCSATLLSPTIVLTAGHCTNNFPGSPYTGMRVFTQSDVEAGIGTTNNYPFAGPNAVEATSWAAHPLYETAPFFLHDVGVVVLSAPVTLPASQYGQLPTVDQFDQLKARRGQKDTTFTAVGYGLQESFPDQAFFLANNRRTRMSATPRLIQINVPGTQARSRCCCRTITAPAVPASAIRADRISMVRETPRPKLSLRLLHSRRTETAPELVVYSEWIARTCSISCRPTCRRARACSLPVRGVRLCAPARIAAQRSRRSSARDTFMTTSQSLRL